MAKLDNNGDPGQNRLTDALAAAAYGLTSDQDTSLKIYTTPRDAAMSEYLNVDCIDHGEGLRLIVNGKEINDSFCGESGQLISVHYDNSMNVIYSFSFGDFEDYDHVSGIRGRHQNLVGSKSSLDLDLGRGILSGSWSRVSNLCDQPILPISYVTVGANQLLCIRSVDFLPARETRDSNPIVSRTFPIPPNNNVAFGITGFSNGRNATNVRLNPCLR